MFSMSANRKITFALAGLILLCLTAPRLWAADASNAAPLGHSTIKLGLTAYADELATTALAEQLLQKLGYTVKTEEADVGIWFAGVARGDLDVGFNAWLPVTHGQYWKRYKDKLQDLGIVYKPTRLGWVVPGFVPKKTLSSIPDLKKAAVKEKLDGKIIGISAGAGLTRLSEQAIQDYGLNTAGYTLQNSSGAAMTAALARAVKRHDWIVVTGWTPHWMWARWNLRYLKDPKNALGKGGSVHVIAGLDFQKQFPRAASFISRFHVSVTDIEQIMNQAQKSIDSGGGSNKGDEDPYITAAKAFIKSHSDLVKKWLQPGKASA